MPSDVPVVLLQPPGACSAFTRSTSSYPPLGLCQLAAAADASLVEVLDADAWRWSQDEALEAVLARKPRLVAMTATTFTLDLVERYAKPLKGAGVDVLVGGPHATLEPLDVFRVCPSVDHLVRGEGEVIFAEVCRRAAERASLIGLQGLCVRGELPTPEILRVDCVDALPWPRFDGLPINSYWCPDAVASPMVTVMTARGCPHHCAYCSSPTLFGSKIRARSPAAVVAELARLRDQFGIEQISFVDDVFSLPRPRTLALCRAMASRDLSLRWFCNARADQIDSELADAMAKAGCHQAYLGFESGSQRMLDAVQKGVTVEDLERGAAVLKAAGIGRSVGFVVGLPGEDDQTIDESIALAHRVKPERIQFSGLTILPGTPLASRAPSSQLRTFHSSHEDQIGEWQRQMYAAVAGQSWGQRSL